MRFVKQRPRLQGSTKKKSPDLREKKIIIKRGYYMELLASLCNGEIQMAAERCPGIIMMIYLAHLAKIKFSTTKGHFRLGR